MITIRLTLLKNIWEIEHQQILLNTKHYFVNFHGENIANAKKNLEKNTRYQ